MKKIVLVEDDEAIRDAFVFALSNEHYEILPLFSAQKMLNHEVSTPDLFVLDKNISGSNGIDYAALLNRMQSTAMFPS